MPYERNPDQSHSPRQQLEAAEEYIASIENQLGSVEIERDSARAMCVDAQRGCQQSNKRILELEQELVRVNNARSDESKQAAAELERFRGLAGDLNSRIDHQAEAMSLAHVLLSLPQHRPGTAYLPEYLLGRIDAARDVLAARPIMVTGHIRSSIER